MKIVIAFLAGLAAGVVVARIYWARAIGYEQRVRLRIQARMAYALGQEKTELAGELKRLVEKL